MILYKYWFTLSYPNALILNNTESIDDFAINCFHTPGNTESVAGAGIRLKVTAVLGQINVSF